MLSAIVKLKSVILIRQEAMKRDWNTKFCLRCGVLETAAVLQKGMAEKQKLKTLFPVKSKVLSLFVCLCVSDTCSTVPVSSLIHHMRTEWSIWDSLEPRTAL